MAHRETRISRIRKGNANFRLLSSRPGMNSGSATSSALKRTPQTIRSLVDCRSVRGAQSDSYIGGYGVAGCWILDAGYWILDAGCWMLDTGCWMLDTGCWILDAGCWMLDTGCWMLEAGGWILAVTHYPSPITPSPITICGESWHNFIIARFFSWRA